MSNLVRFVQVLDLVAEDSINVIKKMIDIYGGFGQFNDNQQYDILITACERGDPKITRYIFDETKFVKKLTDKKRSRLLQRSCQSGSIKQIEFIVKFLNITENIARFRQNQPLRSACLDYNLQVVKFLVETFKLTLADFEDKDGFALMVIQDSNGNGEDLKKYIEQRFHLKFVDLDYFKKFKLPDLESDEFESHTD